jgi:hypothetical protein
MRTAGGRQQELTRDDGLGAIEIKINQVARGLAQLDAYVGVGREVLQAIGAGRPLGFVLAVHAGLLRARQERDDCPALIDQLLYFEAHVTHNNRPLC